MSTNTINIAVTLFKFGANVNLIFTTTYNYSYLSVGINFTQWSKCDHNFYNKIDETLKGEGET